MAKEDIFSKISRIGNYNNELEAVLEKKAFSEDVKNLLLSMLYKIENAYADYETVKRNVEKKKEYVKNIIQIIEEQCKEIEFVKPYTKECEILQGKNFLVDKESDARSYLFYGTKGKYLFRNLRDDCTICSRIFKTRFYYE